MANLQVSANVNFMLFFNRQAELVESIQRALDYMIIVESYDVSATPVVTCLIDLLDHMNVMAEGTRPLRAGRPHVSIEEEQLEFVIEAGFPAGERYSFNVLLFKKNH